MLIALVQLSNTLTGLPIALVKLSNTLATLPVARTQLSKFPGTLQLCFIPSDSAKPILPNAHGVFLSSGERYSKGGNKFQTTDKYHPSMTF
jgi:hypothetical protein